jgi:methionyl-tRNA synthetase
MSTKVIFTSWPYTHALMGIHNLIPMLSGDMLSRFHKLMNDEVILISGCDEYGERMERRAYTENISPQELADTNYAKVKNLLDLFSIDLSVFRRTTDNDHGTFVQKFLTNLFNSGLIEEKYVDSLFCPVCDQFIPDVFVLGSCASCGRFDNLNDHYGSISCAGNGPIEFRDSICGICKSAGVNTPLTSESSKRWAMKIDKDQVHDMPTWTALARSETIKALTHTADWMSISRSVKWGIPLPFDSSQTLFSWVDSLMGNITALMTEEKLRSLGRDTSFIYCMGRDNVPFYSILYPSLLRSLNAESLAPSVIIANHDICFDGLPCSKSQSRTIDLESAAQLLPADYWRAYLISIFPLKANADFSPIFFDDFVRGSLKELDEYIRNVHELCVEFGQGERNDVNDCSGTQISRLASLLTEFRMYMEEYEFPTAMSLVFRTAAESNVQIKSARRADADGTTQACSDFLRELFVLNSLISVFMPETSKNIITAFSFLSENRSLDELYKENFFWQIKDRRYDDCFPDIGFEKAMTKIRDMVVAIEFGNSIDYTTDKHPVRIKWDACNCETWHQAGAVVTDAAKPK